MRVQSECIHTRYACNKPAEGNAGSVLVWTEGMDSSTVLTSGSATHVRSEFANLCYAAANPEIAKTDVGESTNC